MLINRRLYSAFQTLQKILSIPVWIVFAAPVLVSATLLAQQQPTPPGTPAAVPCTPGVEFAKSALWPLIGLIIAVLYRKPLGKFFVEIEDRRDVF